MIESYKIDHERPSKNLNNIRSTRLKNELSARKEQETAGNTERQAVQ